MKQGIFSGRLLRATGVLTVLVLALSSCIKDNLDDCPPPYNVRLRVITDYEKAEAVRTRGTYHQMDDAKFARHRAGWYEDKIARVSVYVFDENDHFIVSWQGSEYLLAEEYTVPFTLEEGKSYHFVAWTNSGRGSLYTPSRSDEELTEEASRGELSMGLELPDDRTLTDEMTHRHFGTLESRPVFSGINDYQIVISPQTYRVNFIVRGLTANENSYEVKVTDRNARHSFFGTPVEGQEPYFHTRTLARTTRAAGEIGASMILLQIGDDTGTAFELANATQGRPLHNGDLLQTIRTAYAAQIGPEKTFVDLDDMLENQYEYDIVLAYSPLGMTVEVHPWDYKGNPTQL